MDNILDMFKTASVFSIYTELTALDGYTLLYVWKTWQKREMPKIESKAAANICNTVFAKAFLDVTNKEKALKTANVQA